MATENLSLPQPAVSPPNNFRTGLMKIESIDMFPFIAIIAPKKAFTN